MPAESPRVLVVDDDPIVAESIADLLRAEGYAAATAHDGQEALALLDQIEQSFQLLITDLNLPRTDGMALLRKLRSDHRDVVPIVMTGYGKIETAVEAIRLGAVDYLTKPIIADGLRLAVRKAANQQALLAENRSLRNELSRQTGLAELVGHDHRMQKVYDLIEAVADSKTTVLVSGESGTGKSLVGRALHALSPRGADRRLGERKRRSGSPERRHPQRQGVCGPFITFACGSIPETLLESELFGHVRGAFTGADTDKPGKILAADGGTLFIDEINSATPALQLKLLRVLQEKCFEPLGSTQTRYVDVRFVLATNENLAELVAAGAFREDLYYRINVVNIALPPLRDRPGDVLVLAEHFLAHFAEAMGRPRKLSAAAEEALQRHTWPGNVRELENALERAVLLSKGPCIEPGDLPETVLGRAGGVAAAHSTHASAAIPWSPMPLAQALLEPERQIVKAALEANGWNRQETARQLDINRTTLYKKIKQFRLDEPG